MEGKIIKKSADDLEIKISMKSFKRINREIIFH